MEKTLRLFLASSYIGLFDSAVPKNEGAVSIGSGSFAMNTRKAESLNGFDIITCVNKSATHAAKTNAIGLLGYNNVELGKDHKHLSVVCSADHVLTKMC
jgi:hypothetical protein